MYNFFMNNSMKIQIKSKTFSKAGLSAGNKRTEKKNNKVEIYLRKGGISLSAGAYSNW